MTIDDSLQIAHHIRFHHKTFTTYNIYRIRELLRYLPARRLTLFQAIPFLLHVNHPDLVGFVNHPRTPFGIHGFFGSGFWKRGLKQFHLDPGTVRPFLSTKTAIHGLYLIGSAGTLAQSIDSDFDYWVVVGAEARQSNRRELLRRKLDGISQWAATAFDQQMTFFILDADQVRENNFADIDEESSGSAQRTLLKEEFYRTFVMIAGRVPFWAVLPTGSSAAEYHQWVSAATTLDTAWFAQDDYIDLGPVEVVAPAECLGAMLWQIYKARYDPIKALLKASLIAHYYFFQDTDGLLCHRIKESVNRPETVSRLLDPYALVFEKAEAFYDWIQDSEGREMIRNAIYLRLIGFPRKRPVLRGSPKQALIASYLRSWQWSEDHRQELDRYTEWAGEALAQFESAIIEKLGFLFELVRNHDDGQHPGIDMAPDDLTSLKNRIAAEFKSRSEKVPRCPLAVRCRLPKDRLIVTLDERNQTWSVRFAGAGDPILIASHPMEVNGWLLGNGLVSPKDLGRSVRWTAARIPARRLEEILSAMVRYFLPRPPGEQPFLRDAENDRMAVVLMDSPPRANHPGADAAFLWRNTWSEFFCAVLPQGSIESPWSRCYTIAQRIDRFQTSPSSRRPEVRIFDFRVRPDTLRVDEIREMIRTLHQPGGKSPEAPDRAEGTNRDSTHTRPILDVY